MSFINNDYRKIFTKAVCGQGQKLTQSSHSIQPAYTPSNILGCWIINHLYSADIKNSDQVEINGSYDVNVWYSYSDDKKTEVVAERVNYCDIIPLSIKDNSCFDEDLDVIAKVEQQPNCLGCKISNKDYNILIKVERNFIVQVIGETTIEVKVNTNKKNHANYSEENSENKDEISFDDDMFSNKS